MISGRSPGEGVDGGEAGAGGGAGGVGGWEGAVFAADIVCDLPFLHPYNNGKTEPLFLIRYTKRM